MSDVSIDQLVYVWPGAGRDPRSGGTRSEGLGGPMYVHSGPDNDGEYHVANWPSSGTPPMDWRSGYVRKGDVVPFEVGSRWKVFDEAEVEIVGFFHEGQVASVKPVDGSSDTNTVNVRCLTPVLEVAAPSSPLKVGDTVRIKDTARAINDTTAGSHPGTGAVGILTEGPRPRFGDELVVSTGRYNVYAADVELVPQEPAAPAAAPTDRKPGEFKPGDRVMAVFNSMTTIETVVLQPRDEYARGESVLVKRDDGRGHTIASDTPGWWVARDALRLVEAVDAESKDPVDTTPEPKVGDIIHLKGGTANTSRTRALGGMVVRVTELNVSDLRHRGRRGEPVLGVSASQDSYAPWTFVYAADVKVIERDGQMLTPNAEPPIAEKTYSHEEVERMLREARQAERDERQQWLERMGEDAIDFANENDMCSQAEVFLSRWEIPHEDRFATRQHEVTVSVTMTIRGEAIPRDVDHYYASEAIADAVRGRLAGFDPMPGEFDDVETEVGDVEVSDIEIV